MRTDVPSGISAVAAAFITTLIAAAVWAQPAPPALPRAPLPVPAPPRTSAVPAPPAASEPEEDDETLFAERDVNEDEWLSGKEIVGFERLDADGDGEVSKKEFLEARAAARRNNPAELKKAIEQAFQALDKNEDGRLSGNELSEFRHFDVNGDKRVTMEEFQAGMAAERRRRRPDAAVGVDLSTLHEAIRTRKADILLSRADESFRPSIDPPVLGLVLTAIHELLGEVAPYDAKQSTTKRVALEGATRLDHSGTFAFDKGEAKVLLQVIDNRIVGLSVNSEELNVLGKWLFEKLGTDPPTAKALAEYLKPQSTRYLKLILDGDDDGAFAMFHPLVQKQLDKDQVSQFFLRMREKYGDFKSLELESQRLEVNERGEDGELSYDYTVKGSQGDFLATVTFQFLGMKAGLTKLTAKPAEVTERKLPAPPVPAAPAPPAPAPPAPAPPAPPATSRNGR